jgi:hypothetical protein
MAITTCTEYREAVNALFLAEQAERDPINQAFEQCTDAAQQAFDAFVAANPQASDAQIEAARAQMEQDKKECSDVATAQLAAIDAKYIPQFADLDRQARESMVIGRLIISWEDLQPAAVALQNVNWSSNTPAPDSAPILTVQSFDDLRGMLEHDRCLGELLLMVRAEDGALVLGGERKTLSEMVAEWTPTVKTRVSDAVYLFGELTGASPQDTDGFRAMLGAGQLRTQWNAATPLTADIRAEGGGMPLCRILAIGKSRKYRAVVAPAGGTIAWTCTGGASIVGSDSAELVEVKGNVESATLDDVVLTLVYILGLNSQAREIKLTVADVKKITVRVKASTAMTPGRGAALADHQFDCEETVEAFPPDKSLILLRGDFEDVELQATVNPTGTPLAWDVKRASDDAASLGPGLPKLDQDPADLTKAKLKANDTGSFFVRVFGDCGNQKFDANGPFKLMPTVLVRAKLQTGATETHPGNTHLPVIVGGPTGRVRVVTGGFDIRNPSKAAIHHSATVDVVSGGPVGRLLIERVFAGWVQDLVADLDWVGSYSGAHSIRTMFAHNTGTGPFEIFRAGDHPDLVQPPVTDTKPLLDTGRANAGTGGRTATLSTSRIRPPPEDLNLGQRWIVEAVDSPGDGDKPLSDGFFFLLDPVFSTAAHPVRLQAIHFEAHFRANLCLWTNRSGNIGGVAEHSYGVLHSYKWDMLGDWSIDANNKITGGPMSVSLVAGLPNDPLVKPSDASCEVCAPTALNLLRRDGSI